MKKMLLVTSLAATLSLPALAESTEDFFYQRGYEMGYNEGFNHGVKKAYEEAKNIMKKYENELRAYEIGKFLIANQNVTFPQVWQESDDEGGIKLRVTPSKIERAIDVEGLFARCGEIPIREVNPADNLELTLEEKNSVNLSDRDSNINDIPQKPHDSIMTNTLQIQKTSKNLDVLKRANVVFSDEGETYNVLFFTEQEKKDFCKNFKICK